MPQTPWQAQVAYYRNRAAEYDLTSYEDVPRADRRIQALLDELRPGGDILEIACGTGIWPAPARSSSASCKTAPATSWSSSSGTSRA